jgi:hypothetical protein
MPPTFLIFLGAIIYVPVVITSLAVGALLFAVPKTRILGKRLIYATLATAPALAVSSAIGAIAVLVVVGGLTVALRPWLPADGPITEPILAAVFGYTTLVTMLVAGLFVVAAVLAGWRIGWRMGPGLAGC